MMQWHFTPSNQAKRPGTVCPCSSRSNGSEQWLRWIFPYFLDLAIKGSLIQISDTTFRHNSLSVYHNSFNQVAAPLTKTAGQDQ